ncbi:MAG: hypothetical protein H0W02_15880 [Ktedonobacteraceae bacterium]|nr:hypothetical protein [Ktedonobacteraceae bacterium]
MADSMILAPYDLMRDIARTMNTDSENLLNEYQQRWHILQTATAALPASMQGIFNNFLGKNGPPLTEAITMRQQIGQTLSQAADMAEKLDKDMSISFNNF